MKCVNLTSNGGTKIAGPLFVGQRLKEPGLPLVTTASAVDKLVMAYPNSQVDYITLRDITHTPALFALQCLCGYRPSQVPNPPQRTSSYQLDAHWIITTAIESHQLAEQQPTRNFLHERFREFGKDPDKKHMNPGMRSFTM